MVRRLYWAALGALLSASCVLAFDGEQAADNGDDDDVAPETCFSDTDCVLAGPTCCDCPSYALPLSSGWTDSCANVDCTVPNQGAAACTPLVARCDFGACIAECAPVACPVSCPQGFVTDATGCLACECNAMPPLSTCEYDMDCVEVPADCCGCARGGADTAVPRTAADQHVRDLMCPDDPAMSSCPDVSTCDAARVPRCLEHQCALVGPNDPGWAQPPRGACGRTDLPPCPAGEVCVLNQNDEAGQVGLGVCQPQ